MGRQDNIKLIDLSLVLLHETEKAYLLAENFSGDKKAWVAKKLVQDNDDETWTVPEWLAKEKEWI